MREQELSPGPQDPFDHNHGPRNGPLRVRKLDKYDSKSHHTSNASPEGNCALPVGLKLLVGEEVRINFVDADEGIALKSETL